MTRVKAETVENRLTNWRIDESPYRDDCTLSSPTGCRGCGKPPVKPKLYYCSDACQLSYLSNHSWGIARWAASYPAIRLDGGYIYVEEKPKPCAREDESCEGAIEIDHMVPLNGRRPHVGCVHHQDGLLPLCHSHHVRETMIQRRDGRIGTPESAAALRAADAHRLAVEEKRRVDAERHALLNPQLF